MRRCVAALSAGLATALFAGHPQKIPVKPVRVAIEPPPTTLGGPDRHHADRGIGRLTGDRGRRLEEVLPVFAEPIGVG